MEIEKLSTYEFIKPLGRGAFAQVWLAKSTKTNQLVAIKKVILKQSTQKDISCALTEVRLLASIYHENIISFKDAFFNSQHEILYLVMEYAGNGDLNQKIEYLKDKKRYMPEEEIWKFIAQISGALKILHDNHIIHRDLKSANIFITEDGNYKLADFNIAKLVTNYNGLAQTKIGTPLYTSPDIWNSGGYGIESDIWSLGVIVYQFTCLELPFPANSFPELYRKITETEPKKLPKVYSSTLERVIMSMLSKNYLRRPKVDELIELAAKRNNSFNRLSAGNGTGRSNVTAEKKKLKSRLSMIETIRNPIDIFKLELCEQRLKTQNQQQLGYKQQQGQVLIRRRSRISHSFHYQNNQQPILSKQSSQIKQNSFPPNQNIDNKQNNDCKQNNQNQENQNVLIRKRVKSHYRSRVISHKPILNLKLCDINHQQPQPQPQPLILHPINNIPTSSSASNSQLKKQHIALKPIHNIQKDRDSFKKPPLPTAVPFTDRHRDSSKQSKKVLRLPSLSMHRS